MNNYLLENDVIESINDLENIEFDRKKVYNAIRTLINKINNLEKELSNKEIEKSSIILNYLMIQEFLKSLIILIEETKSLDKINIYNSLNKLEKKIKNYLITEQDVWNYLYNHFLINNNKDLIKSLKEYSLSEAELKICALIYLNFSTKDIAYILKLSPRTIETHKYNIRKKLSLSKEKNIYEFLNDMKQIKN
jgi:DNA-binding CsgD family transcriptional regulator